MIFTRNVYLHSKCRSSSGEWRVSSHNWSASAGGRRYYIFSGQWWSLSRSSSNDIDKVV